MYNEHCNFLAKYNGWMNDRLFTVCAGIPDHARKAERGAFFGSVHGTLNHLLLADRIWLGRFQNTPYPATRLDAILYEDFAELRTARALEDGRISAWCETLDAAALSSSITYTGIVEPVTRTCNLWTAVTHFFNHQTHHRGQLTTLLAQIGIDYGATDMIAMPGVVQQLNEI